MESKADIIMHKCNEADCNPEQKKRHFQLYVHELWDVHPDPEFQDWLKTTYEGICGVATITAWNTERIRQAYFGARQYGIA